MVFLSGMVWLLLLLSVFVGIYPAFRRLASPHRDELLRLQPR
jgi:hypothetical protein